MGVRLCARVCARVFVVCGMWGVSLNVCVCSPCVVCVMVVGVWYVLCVVCISLWCDVCVVWFASGYGVYLFLVCICVLCVLRGVRGVYAKRVVSVGSAHVCVCGVLCSVGCRCGSPGLAPLKWRHTNVSGFIFVT